MIRNNFSKEKIKEIRKKFYQKKRLTNTLGSKKQNKKKKKQNKKNERKNIKKIRRRY